MAKIAFIGLGVMGGAMARHLSAAGHDVTVYNRTVEKATAWVAQNGGNSAQTPALAAANADVVIACVGADADLESVTLGNDGAYGAMPRGALFIDHTTVSARIARELAEAANERGIACVDAPVSGGQAGAENGTLTIMCGGMQDGYDRAALIMQAYASRMVHIGPSGAGQQAKMVNQIAIAGVLQGLSEAIRFALAADLDTDKVFEAISGGAAASWQMLNRWPTMTKDEFDFGFAVDWMRKDLGLALDEAKSSGATLPLAALVDQFYAEVQALGGGRQDTSALIRRLAKR